jgi:hypothetical protein
MERLQEILDESSDPENPGPQEIKDIMERVKTIAVVGMSRSPDKEARRVPSYLAAKGYDIIPVNPFVDTIIGKEAKDSLADIEGPVDMVLVFRPSEEAAQVARVAMDREERPVIWLQEGITADQEAREAREKGIPFVQDLCSYQVHKAL